MQIFGTTFGSRLHGSEKRPYADRFRRFGKAAAKTDNMGEENYSLITSASCTFKVFSKILKKESVLQKLGAYI